MGTSDLLGPLESKVMEVMWRSGEATVRQVMDVLEPPRGVAYTTVMTIMSNLVRKGLLRSTSTGKAYLYSVALSREAFLEHKAQEAVSEVLERFGDLAIARFMEAAARISPENLQRLREAGSPKPDRSGWENNP